LRRYIKTLHIVNFQSHADTLINLDPGLNILVGESDQGKTAVIRALRWVMYNEPRGTGYIRVGESRCEVTITLNDGTRISRIRDERQRINRYVLKVVGQEEQIFEKFKNEVPLEIQQELGVYPLWIDRDRSLELNLARQLDNPFLLTESAATRAKVIGRIAHLHVLDAAQRDVLRDIKNLSRTKSGLENEITSLEDKARQFDDLPEKEEQLNQLKEKINQITRIQNQITRLSNIKERIDRAAISLEQSQRVIDRLEQIEQANQVMENCLHLATTAEIAEKLHSKIVSAQNQLVTCLAKIKSLQNITLCINIHNQLQSNAGLLMQVEKIKTAHDANHKKLLYLQAVINQTASIRRGDAIIHRLYELRQEGVGLQDLRRRIKDIYQKIQKRSIQQDNVNEELKRLAELEHIEALAVRYKNMWVQFNALNDLFCRYRQAISKIENAQKKLQTVEENYRKMVNDYVEVLTQAGRCPTCQSPITPEVVKKISDSVKLSGT
jgi:exonuclease SbcC